MKLLYLFFFLLTFHSHEQTVKGTVTFGGSPMPGATVTLENTGASTVSDKDGEYTLRFPGDIKNIVLELSLPGGHYGVVTRIENITITAEETDLGSMPFFLGKSIDVNEYKSLSNEEKTDYEAMYHYTHLIGYVSKTQIDSAEIRFPCQRKDIKVAYRHTVEKNKVIFDFKDLPLCRH